MAEFFLRLSSEDQREILEVAATRSGRPPHLLEKDVWVVWALKALFGSTLGKHLVFKGGTSLSKAYGVIRRFSEDVDLTYDIRALVPDLVGTAGPALPATRSEERRWTTAVRHRLPEWVAEQALPVVADSLSVDGIEATVTAQGEALFIVYQPLTKVSSYVAPRVMLEFGARSTGEPNAHRNVSCDAASYIDNVVFPTAMPRVMSAERTFWEKATAAHVFCVQGRLRGERFARHWHDLTRLDEAGYVETAAADHDLASDVARHKSLFFAEKAADGSSVDYAAAVTGSLRLTPDGLTRAALADDYRRMVDDGLFLDDAESFEVLMSRCAAIAKKVNAAAPSP